MNDFTAVTEIEAFSKALTHAFGVPVQIFFTETPIALTQLNAEELEFYGALKNEKRRLSWRKGRQALSQLTGHSDERSKLTFPHSKYSISHSGDFGVAAVMKSDKQCGFGLDFQMPRPIKLDAAKFFLTASEKQFVETLQSVEAQQDMLLRLWTIKESVFKADPHNHSRTLTHYELQHPESVSGVAFCRDIPEKAFRYSSTLLAPGFISVCASYLQSDMTTQELS